MKKVQEEKEIKVEKTVKVSTIIKTMLIIGGLFAAFVLGWNYRGYNEAQYNNAVTQKATALVSQLKSAK